MVSPAANLELPGYTLGPLIGRGGMAVVHVAVQQSLARKVALKLLVRDGSPQAAETSRQFLHEAHLLAGLRHRNIVTVYDVVCSEAADFITMEYLEGGSLAERCRFGLALPEALSVIAQLADALDHAHAAGILHRDLKPENVLFRDPRTPVLIDFGIARPAHSEGSRPQFDDMVAGTPVYMSPEQIEGAPLDARSDLYSLGITAFELLTGRPPFTSGSAADIMRAHLERPPPPLPADLTALQPVLDSLLAKSPATRYVSARAMLQDARQRMLQAPELLARLSSVPGDSASERLLALGFADTGRFSAAHITQRELSPPPTSTLATPRRPLASPRMRWALAALLLAALAWLWPPSPGHSPSPSLARQAAAKPARVAVLPFANLSGNGIHDLFVDGLHDELLTALTSVGELAVISRTTMMSYRGQAKPLEQIARELAASHVIECTVRRDDQHLRLNASLIDAESDTTLWSASFERPLEQATALQREVALALAAALQHKPAVASQAGFDLTRQIHPLALERYAQARQLTTFDREQREHLLDEAIAAAPEFGSAYAERAYNHAVIYWNGNDASAERARRAADDVARARLLLGASPHSLAVEAYLLYYIERRYQAALQRVQEALAAFPNDADLHYLAGLLLRRMDRWDAARNAFAAAQQLDPYNRPLREDLMYAEAERGAFDQALQSALALHAESPSIDSREAVLQFWYLLSLEEAVLPAWIESASGDRDPSVRTIFQLLAPSAAGDHASMRRVLAEHPDPWLRLAGGYRVPIASKRAEAAWLQGDRALLATEIAAARGLLDAEGQRLADSALVLMEQSLLQALAGEQERAHRGLQRALERGAVEGDNLLLANLRIRAIELLLALADHHAAAKLLSTTLAGSPYAEFAVNLRLRLRSLLLRSAPTDSAIRGPLAELHARAGERARQWRQQYPDWEQQLQRIVAEQPPR